MPGVDLHLQYVVLKVCELSAGGPPLTILACTIPAELKRRHILEDLAARVELVPFPRSFELEFLRDL
jgi:hypothetical protein